jgi:hypothetical protein
MSTQQPEDPQGPFQREDDDVSMDDDMDDDLDDAMSDDIKMDEGTEKSLVDFLLLMDNYQPIVPPFQWLRGIGA